MRLTQTPTPTSTYQGAIQQRGPAAVGYTPGPEKKKKSLMSVLGQLISVASKVAPMMKGGAGKMMPSGDKLKEGMARMPSIKDASKIPDPTRHFKKGTTDPISTAKSNSLTTTKPNTNFFAKENWSAISKASGQMADMLSGGSKYGALSNTLQTLATIGKKENNKTLRINDKEDE